MKIQSVFLCALTSFVLGLGPASAKSAELPREVRAHLETLIPDYSRIEPGTRHLVEAAICEHWDDAASRQLSAATSGPERQRVFEVKLGVKTFASLRVLASLQRGAPPLSAGDIESGIAGDFNARVLAAVVQNAARIAPVLAPYLATGSPLPLSPRSQNVVADRTPADPWPVVKAFEDQMRAPAAPGKMRGAPNGAHTLVVYFDPNCGYCKNAEPKLDALLAKDKELRIIYRDLPVLGPASERAVLWSAAVSLTAPEKWPSFHSKIMASTRPPVDTDEPFVAIATALGMDARDLAQRASSLEAKAQIEPAVRFAQAAKQAGVGFGTPFFYAYGPGETQISFGYDRETLMKAWTRAVPDKAGTTRSGG
jgi:protein-disulfide isomerase